MSEKHYIIKLKELKVKINNLNNQVNEIVNTIHKENKRLELEYKEKILKDPILANSIKMQKLDKKHKK